MYHFVLMRRGAEMQLSKEALDFDLGDSAPPLNEVIKDTFIITNTTAVK